MVVVVVVVVVVVLTLLKCVWLAMMMSERLSVV